MRLISLFLIFFGPIFLCVGNLNAQSIHISQTDGNGQTFQLSDIKKIIFVNRIMYIHLKDGSVIDWNLYSVGSFQYEIQQLLIAKDSFNALVYPNPSPDNFNVIYNLPDESPIIISLFDMTGKLIFSENFGTEEKGVHQKSFNISEFTQGQYILRISGDRGQIEKKIIRN
jgi:hypothetical protein